MKNAINQTKRLILNYRALKNSHYDPNYRPFYWFTNENVAAYLNHLNVSKNQRALSVLASGDQAFNLIAKGINDIDTFYINGLTEYYVFGLKLAIITKYNYKDFCEVYSKLLDPETTPKEIADIIFDLLPLMDKKYRTYWRETIDFCLKKDNHTRYTLNLTRVLLNERPSIYTAKKLNIYLKNESNYNQFKQKLQHSNISFVRTNVTELPEKFTKNYDYLLLSNVLDYIYINWGIDWTINDLNIFLKKLEPIMNKNALIFLHYCFSSDSLDTPFVYAKEDISFSDFKADEVLTFPGKYGNSNAMILKRINQINFSKNN